MFATKFVLAALLGVSAMAENRMMITEEMVEYLKHHAQTWEPMEVSENPFAGFTREELASRLGAFDSHKDFEGAEEYNGVLDNLASSFDWRQEYKSCIHGILDQGSCGSCWAFGSSESLSDRFCIASNGAVDVVLSPQYQVSCDSGQYGCGGGYLKSTWQFLKNTGTVLNSCVSYTSGKFGIEPACPSKCDDGSALHHYKCSTIHSAFNPSSIKSLIQSSGPVEVQFHVYDDFYNYKKGVYTRQSLNYVGDHDVKVVGWGQDSASGLNYWIAQNSWGGYWGESGFFRIAEGECGFDDDAYACDPDLSSASLFEALQ